MEILLAGAYTWPVMDEAPWDDLEEMDAQPDWPALDDEDGLAYIGQHPTKRRIRTSKSWRRVRTFVSVYKKNMKRSLTVKRGSPTKQNNRRPRSLNRRLHRS